LEKIFGLLQINHVTPLGFSQQFEAQQSLPEKFFYVEGCWRCCLIFNVEATLRVRQEEWLSVEIRVYPPTLLGQVRQALSCSPAAVPCLSRYQAIAEDPTESSRGLLGHFSSTQMDFIESHFVSVGEPDPIWAAPLLVDVEEAWDRTTEPNPDLASGELPISPQLYQTDWKTCLLLRKRASLPLIVGAPGARASSPSAGGTPVVLAFSPSDEGSVCGDVTWGSSECFGGGGALGEVVAVSLETAPL